MLQSLHLRNFQCHKRLDIELDQVVSIIGKSDVGRFATPFKEPKRVVY